MIGLCVFCAIAFSWLANAQATIIPSTCGGFDVFFYDNGVSDGTVAGAQNWTDTQKADVLASINTWTSKIGNKAARQVRLHMFWRTLSGDTLASSYNPIHGDYTGHAATYTEWAYRDGDSTYYDSQYDAYIVFDIDGASSNWNYGSAPPTSNTNDFRTTVTHEIGHTLGFASTFNFGMQRWPTSGLTNGMTNWDCYLQDSAGVTAQTNSPGTLNDFNETDNPVYFTGGNAVDANGGNLVQVYAPSTYSLSSSLIHLNGSAIYSDAVMNPRISPGTMLREPSALEWGIMKDLGWTIVPEPGTWVMLLGMGIFLSARFFQKR